MKIYFASKGQIARLHIAKKELKLDDETYRKNLASFENVLSGSPVKHANELTSYQADKLLEQYKAAGWKQQGPHTPASSHPSQEGTSANHKWSKGSGKLKYEELANRDVDYPSPAQLRYIEFKWRLCSNEKTVESFQRFLKNKFGLADITWILKHQVQKIIKAIESLAKEGQSS